MAEKADPRNTASSSASSSQAPAEKTPSPGRTSSRKEQTENMQPGLPVKEWKTSRKPTVSESEVWFYAKNQIKNIARDKRDVFEFPEFGVPDTGMKKVAENLYEVKGFFKVKTHDGKEKMYRFTITSMNLASSSMPRHTRSVSSQAINVEPEPRNGSSTMALVMVLFLMG